jgi:hypothetical protein
VGKNSVLFAHVPEPDLHVMAGWKRTVQCSFRTRIRFWLSNNGVTSCSEELGLLYTFVPSNKRFDT